MLKRSHVPQTIQTKWDEIVYKNKLYTVKTVRIVHECVQKKKHRTNVCFFSCIKRFEFVVQYLYNGRQSCFNHTHLQTYVVLLFYDDYRGTQLHTFWRISHITGNEKTVKRIVDRKMVAGRERRMWGGGEEKGLTCLLVTSATRALLSQSLLSFWLLPEYKHKNTLVILLWGLNVIFFHKTNIHLKKHTKSCLLENMLMDWVVCVCVCVCPPCCGKPHCVRCPGSRCVLPGWGRWLDDGWRPWSEHQRSHGVGLEERNIDMMKK